MITVICSLCRFVLNILCNKLRFVICRIKLPQTDLLPFFIISPKSLFFSAFIVADHTIRNFQYIPDRAVVLFQFNYFCI